MRLPQIGELCAHVQNTMGKFPYADDEILAAAVMARLGRERQIASAAGWIGMGGSPERGTSANARASVSNFGHAMAADPEQACS